ncbi:hypothetical protein A3C17_01630 [Candidatus Uhrbacteria bacterium RIFCSPHIGHO2_02_FULL_53_13]|uniref:DUF8128 domain-containing protein n=2 Tax=Candidatus Uhriibacteriota TaxID=1752732 RepID=A0A1F7U1F9_9BACT|nr:MAG: hypothetical protein A3C17_01630 [Candidatus Uhrbacteria bacterium RIFCSPHIGHO2_02_FULL_53_13]OGL89491.1 MAG: hypothetical protein A3I45_00205 [Candidatus Uhrbacteria bacterium RIFCSPLOWO2_02_FULL_53_10]
MLPLFIYALVINLDELDRFVAEPFSYWFLKLLIFGSPLIGVIIWGAFQLWLDHRQGVYASKQKFIVLAIDVPRSSEQTIKAVENIFAIIKGTKSVITLKEEWWLGKYLLSTSFELVSIDGYIQFYIRCSSSYRDLYEAAIYAQYPDAEITEVEDYLKNLPDAYPNDTHEVFGGELKLANKPFFPIRTWMDFEHTVSKEQVFKDPLIALLEFMGKLKQGEQFYVHFIVNPDDADSVIEAGSEYLLKTYEKEAPKKKGKLEALAEPIAWFPKEVVSQFSTFLSEASGDEKKPSFSFFRATDREKSQLEGVAQKISKQGYKTKIRWAYCARHEVYNKGGRNTLWKAWINLFAHFDRNKFKYDVDTMPRDDYFWMRWEYRKNQNTLMKALKGRSFSIGSTPMYLNLEELATLWHFPSIDVQAPSIKKTQYKLGEAPTSLPEAGFGESDELPFEPLVEVDEHGRPIEYAARTTSKSPARLATAELVPEAPLPPSIPRDTAPVSENDSMDDILPTGPLIELEDAVFTAKQAQGDDAQDDEPTPLNLPV